VAKKLQEEIRQKTPFASVEEEAYLNLQRTADALKAGLSELLKASELTPTQYNVLRILRGAHPDGLPCGEVAERMVTREPDMTRLLDRMEARGLVGRARDTRDRRVVYVEITTKGLGMLSSLDKPVSDLLKGQLAHLGAKRVATLVDLLEQTRTPRK